MIKAKGVERTVIVSDAAPISGMHPGKYSTLGNEVILEPSGRLYNPVKGNLVGSSATLLQCMSHLASLGFLSLEELLKVGLYNPLHLLGLDPGMILPSGNRLLFDQDENAVYRRERKPRRNPSARLTVVSSGYLI
jgi:N-acetylglucosamine-6-phosphate deacetylase